MRSHKEKDGGTTDTLMVSRGGRHRQVKNTRQGGVRRKGGKERINSKAREKEEQAPGSKTTQTEDKEI